MISVLAFVYSCYTAFGLVASLSMTVWIIFALFMAAGYGYLFGRTRYLQRRGYDLTGELKKPYGPWEERERELEVLDAQKTRR